MLGKREECERLTGWYVCGGGGRSRGANACEGSRKGSRCSAQLGPTGLGAAGGNMALASTLRCIPKELTAGSCQLTAFLTAEWQVLSRQESAWPTSLAATNRLGNYDQEVK